MIPDPRAQPAADVSAAGNGGEIVKFIEQAAAREALQDPKRECCAANAATREAECRARRLLLMDALVNGFQERLFFGDAKFLCVLVSELSIEFLSQNVSKRFRRRARMCLITYRNNFPRQPGYIPVLRWRQADFLRIVAHSLSFARSLRCGADGAC